MRFSGPFSIRYPSLRLVRRGALAVSEAACSAGAIPVFALGGITPDRARQLFASHDATARPAGVASIGAIFAADSPAVATAEMLAALNASSTRRQ